MNKLYTYNDVKYRETIKMKQGNDKVIMNVSFNNMFKDINKMDIMKPKIDNRNNNIILSLTTTPKRVIHIFKNIKMFEEIKDVNRVIINMCLRYKRFNIRKYNVNKIIQLFNLYNNRYEEDKYVLNILDDYGPITKLIGGYRYMMKNNITDKYLIIIDDDIKYEDNNMNSMIRAARQMSMRDDNYLISTKGFILSYCNNLYGDNVRTCEQLDDTGFKYMDVDVVEGFGGILFNPHMLIKDEGIKLLDNFVEYYKLIDWGNKYVSDVNIALKACFLGDDLVISWIFNKYFNKRLIKLKLDKDIVQYKYGFEDDALHKNKYFKNNMGSYKTITNNIDIARRLMDTMRIKKDLLRSIKLLSDNNNVIRICEILKNKLRPRLNDEYRLKVSVSLIVKDNERWMKYITKYMERMERKYDKIIDFEYYIYENNSVDGTKGIISDFMRIRRGKYVCEDIKKHITFKKGIDKNRGLWMIYIRNKNKSNHGKLSSDYMWLIDSDVYFKDENILMEMLRTFESYDNIAQLSTYCYYKNKDYLYGEGHYYDSLALVDLNDISYKENINTCLFDRCKGCINYRKIHLGEELSKKIELLPSTGIIKVRSAFGSMCMIPTKYYNECEYDEKEYFKYDHVCEHYMFNMQLTKYGDIVINTDIKCANNNNLV